MCGLAANNQSAISRMYTVDCPSGCSDDSDCDENQKCVDGECVDCEEVQATHFQVRWEFPTLTTNSDGDSFMYLLSAVTSIASANSGLVLLSPSFNNNKVYARIRFCDSSGAIALYKGSGYFCPVGGLNGLYPTNLPSSEISSYLSSEVDAEANLATGTFQASTYVNIGASDVIYEPDCSGLTPEEPPAVVPVEPPTEPDPEVLFCTLN